MGTAVRVALGLLWWWAALRLALDPRASGAVEAGVVLAGWSVSLLPVHCVAKERATGVVVATGRWVRALRGRRAHDR
ncbi:hypothetical protein [Streptomyces abyssomicinicus]|uniref:hypothetical protein n=1 Tax=Streptomyces abyssomicinicus TaxID=574929 RepID=UPI001250A23B|nr:hypothetical protein [Streptomyces abyssomicinicus]